MRRVCWTILPTFVCFTFLCANAADTQDQQTPQTQTPNPAPQPLTKKGRKKQAQQLAKESAPYTTWVNEEVIYIITKEEREAFLRLTTNEEREQYIEEFWRRRNPDPDSPDNA